MTNGNEYTSPQASASSNKDGYQMTVSGGLTKREYFAATAMQGFVSAHQEGHLIFQVAAEASVRFADALIEALNEEEKKTAR